MKRNVYKYAMSASVLVMSVFIFFSWFAIGAGGVIAEETHSFMTIPNLVGHGADTLAKLSSKGVAISMLIFCGVLKYLCILSSALGVWGVVLTFVKNKKNRLLYTSQAIASMLFAFALLLLIVVNILSNAIVGGTVSVAPTLWFVIFTVSLILSYVFGYLFSKEN